MTFEKLLEEQRQRLHSVGRLQTDDLALEETAHQVTTAGDNELLSTTQGFNGENRNEFYQVFSKVRARNAPCEGAIPGGPKATDTVKTMEASRAKAM